MSIFFTGKKFINLGLSTTIHCVEESPLEVMVSFTPGGSNTLKDDEARALWHHLLLVADRRDNPPFSRQQIEFLDRLYDIKGTDQATAMFAQACQIIPTLNHQEIAGVRNILMDRIAELQREAKLVEA